MVTSKQELLARRQRALGPAYHLFYDDPVHVVRGEGCWLYDDTGRKYLDAYNNVPHVGHCHSHVVNAIAAQARRLNLNTRYLHETIVEYAERLSATLPEGLEVCMFVCTGTEANELAWRMAQAWSGAQGAIATAFAYHGNSTFVSSFSAEELRLGRSLPNVKTIPSPDGYGGRYRREVQGWADRYAAHVDEAIQALQGEGYGVAAVYFDSVFLCDGIWTAPPGFLEYVFQRVRAAGGLCIADEVQGGFGRTGEHFWSFAFAEVMPDIVTVGKPMGNGHPIGAMITTQDIAAKFAKTCGYFNTFGGNPVSCAAGAAVLDVLEREGLQGNARQTGAYLRSRLQALMNKHDMIGDVRGAGLITGVELVRDRHTREPARNEATLTLNRMREKGVFIGLTGHRQNTLKIRPPMVFGRHEADLLTEVLDETLAEIENG
jgi:4-aminobutyrate aminotransferase-like enzyme